MWANMLGESSLQSNFNVGFNNYQTEVLIHLSQWQYWWWFWFFLLWVIYFYLMVSMITRSTMYFNPILNTSMQSHGKWGDFLISMMPVFWCFNILLNSNFILRMIEWQNENSLFTLKIQGKQWYWVYKYNTDTTQSLFSVSRNIGHNNNFSLFGDDLYTKNSFFAGVNASSSFEYMNDFESVSEKYFKNSNNKLFLSKHFRFEMGDYFNMKSRNYKKNMYKEIFSKNINVCSMDFFKNSLFLNKNFLNFNKNFEFLLNLYKNKNTQMEMKDSTLSVKKEDFWDFKLSFYSLFLSVKKEKLINQKLDLEKNYYYNLIISSPESPFSGPDSDELKSFLLEGKMPKEITYRQCIKEPPYYEKKTTYKNYFNEQNLPKFLGFEEFSGNPADLGLLLNSILAKSKEILLLDKITKIFNYVKFNKTKVKDVSSMMKPYTNMLKIFKEMKNLKKSMLKKSENNFKEPTFFEIFFKSKIYGKMKKKPTTKMDLKMMKEWNFKNFKNLSYLLYFFLKKEKLTNYFHKSYMTFLKKNMNSWMLGLSMEDFDKLNKLALKEKCLNDLEYCECYVNSNDHYLPIYKNYYSERDMLKSLAFKDSKKDYIKFWSKNDNLLKKKWEVLLLSKIIKAFSYKELFYNKHNFYIKKKVMKNIFMKMIEIKKNQKKSNKKLTSHKTINAVNKALKDISSENNRFLKTFIFPMQTKSLLSKIKYIGGAFYDLGCGRMMNRVKSDLRADKIKISRDLKEFSIFNSILKMNNIKKLPIDSESLLKLKVKVFLNCIKLPNKFTEMWKTSFLRMGSEMEGLRLKSSLYSILSNDESKLDLMMPKQLTNSHIRSWLTEMPSKFDVILSFNSCQTSILMEKFPKVGKTISSEEKAANLKEETQEIKKIKFLKKKFKTMKKFTTLVEKIKMMKNSIKFIKNLKKVQKVINLKKNINSMNSNYDFFLKFSKTMIKNYLNTKEIFNFKIYNEHKPAPSMKYMHLNYISMKNLMKKLYEKSIKNQQQFVFEDESPEDFDFKIKLFNNESMKPLKMIPTILNKHILQSMVKLSFKKNSHLLCNLILESETGSFLENESSAQNSSVIKQKKMKRKDFFYYSPQVEYNPITTLGKWHWNSVDKVWESRYPKQMSKIKYRMYSGMKSTSKNTELMPIELAKSLLSVRSTLMLPVHNNITIMTNSYDVVHSWFVPGLGLKLDCVPGRSTHHSFYVDNVGFYYGQCAEICGRYHHHMPMSVCALPFEHFMFWWQKKGLKRLSKKQLNNVYNDKLKNMADLKEAESKSQADPEVMKDKKKKARSDKSSLNNLLKLRLKTKFWKWMPILEKKKKKIDWK